MPKSSFIARLFSGARTANATAPTSVTGPSGCDDIRRVLLESSLFDEAYYCKNIDVADIQDDALNHYILIGERIGLKPNFYFEPTWYQRQNGIDASQTNLLAHYIIQGERNGHSPSLHFDPAWYSTQAGIDTKSTCALSHYLRSDKTTTSPNFFFDAECYIKNNPDVAAGSVDPYQHYVQSGIFEDRIASMNFNANHVWRQYLNNDRSKNPLLLFLQHGASLGWAPTPTADQHTIPRQIRISTSPAPEFEKSPVGFAGARKLKAIAFYLPQFHAIPENDEWWGKGFTEWRNVPRGVPRFVGHHQPRVPGDLGFYELKGTEKIKEQIELARGAGLFGFCFYYYNFNGRRLLERPLDAFVEDTSINFPFCLLWANENWSRRWDGLDQELLISQSYDPKAEDAVIDDLARYMMDPRYVRIDGRPVFFLYRSDVVPDTKVTIERWRNRFRSLHGIDPLIIMSQTFGLTDPRPAGFDGAMEFPPHKYGSRLPRITAQLEVLDPDFCGEVYQYDDLVKASLEDFPKDYPLLKTVVPSWDNDARKQGTGLVVHGATPAKFQTWIEELAHSIEDNRFHGEKLLMINAWNEWCEGAYLEPDVHFGFGFLNAVSRAIGGGQHRGPRKLLLVGHGAFPAGAQMLLCSIGRTLKTAFGVEVAFILMDGGALQERYEQIGPTFVADLRTDFSPALRAFVYELRAKGFSHAITNSVLSGHCVSFLADSGFKVCSLVHELKTFIQRAGGFDRYQSILRRSSDVVYPNEYVRDELLNEFGAPSGRMHIAAQGLYKDIVVDEAKSNTLRELLKLPLKTRIVLNAGYGDLRKGVDLFMGLARETAQLDPDIHFVWVGDLEPAVETWIVDDVRRGRARNVSFLSFTENVDTVLNSADLFFLTSREDPFPSVVLEALAVGLPVGAFDTGGGYVDLLRSAPFAGFLAPAGDLAAASRHIVEQLQVEAVSGHDLRPARRALISAKYNFREYVFRLLNIVERAWKISVIVPNYNYKSYLNDRLASIFDQKHPIWEVIVLDDCSSDGSSDELEKLSKKFARDFTLIENDENSGRVFKQWRRGLEAASGDLVWIAEADDLSHPDFLDRLAVLFNDPALNFAFSDSRTIDEFGVAEWESYKGYYSTVFPGALAESGVFDSKAFLEKYLSVRNLILNVSSVLWRKNALMDALAGCESELDRFKLAGDWRVYVAACMLGGKVGYEAAPLNVHRRHSTSVTHSLSKAAHRAEIIALHDVIDASIGLESSQKLRQNAYVAEISREFGLG